MTNFEYYKTKESAVEAYSKKESIYNIHEGVSAGRFINWLYEEYVEEKSENNKRCMFGKCSTNGCEHCKNGYCTGIILTSYPPQYQRCQFVTNIPEYKYCSDV